MKRTTMAYYHKTIFLYTTTPINMIFAQAYYVKHAVFYSPTPSLFLRICVVINYRRNNVV